MCILHRGLLLLTLCVACTAGVEKLEDLDGDPEPPDPQSPGRPEMFTSGASHACKLADGSLFCWGKNDEGQLGLGRTTVLEPTPIALAAVNDVVFAAVGVEHTCALSGLGSVYCFGQNRSGQLGDGTTESASTPQRVEGIDDADLIIAGVEETCVRRRENNWMCWGAARQTSAFRSHLVSLGVPVAEEPISSPVIAPRARGAEEIALGLYMGCLRSGGVVECWGYWQSAEGFGWRDPVQVEISPAANIVAGDFRACALASDTTVECFHTFDLRAQKVAGLDGVIELAHSKGNFCALRENGSVWCWDFGPAHDQAPRPRELVALARARELEGGGMICALGQDDRRRCFGTDNRYGQRGSGEALIEPEPIAVLEEVTDLSASTRGVCAVTKAGGVLCWGDATGPRRESERTRPTPVRHAREIHMIGGNCGLGSDGSVRCWDARHWGVQQASPPLEELSPSSSTRSIAIGIQWKCGLDTRDQISCFEPDDWPPREVGGALELVAGDVHACARMFDGQVYCWGRGSNGQLGDGTFGDGVREELGLVELPGRAEYLAAADAGTCARLTGGEVWCWGKIPLTGYDAEDLAYPARIDALFDAREISIGLDGVCFVDRDTAVRCMGDNALGQSGGNEIGRPIYTPISGGATRVKRGGVHACAIMEGGQLRCWGDGRAGSLGDGRLEPDPFEVFEISIEAPE